MLFIKKDKCMRKVYLRLIAVCLLLIILIIGIFSIINRYISFICSNNRDYLIAEVCIDLGGAGYWGNFYFINKSGLLPMIYDTNCNSPGSVIWRSETEFDINNRSGTHRFFVNKKEGSRLGEVVLTIE